MTFASFHWYRLFWLKYCLWLVLRWNNSFFCILSNFIYWNFNVFCFQRSSCHSFNTSLFWCQYRINQCTEFDQKFLFLLVAFHISKVSKQRGLRSFLIILTKQTTNSGLKIKKLLKIAKVAKKMFHFPELKENWLKKWMEVF